MKVLSFCVGLVVLLASSGLSALASAPSPERAYIDAVVDALVEQGVLTQAQAEAVKAKGEAAAAAAGAKAAPAKPTPAEAPKKKLWTDTVKVSGYIQGRWAYYPDETTVKDANGDSRKVRNEFMVRRARVTIEGRPTPNTKVSFQPAFDKGEVTITDAYIERSFGKEGSSRLRLGSQYVPLGFEVPQSTSALLPLEGNWTATRALPGTRDTGLTYFYTTPEDHKLFEMAKSKHLGPGDYGNFSISLFNGQGIGKEGMEVDSNKHLNLSLRKPFSLGKGDEYAELGASYYTGDYLSKAAKAEFDREVLCLHGFVAPTPVGLQAEYYTGETEGHDLDGWYAMGLWHPVPEGTAYVRYDDYNGWRTGANKADDRHRWSIGYAWQMDEASRLTVEYSRDVLDTATGGDADMAGVQWLVKF